MSGEKRIKSYKRGRLYFGENNGVDFCLLNCFCSKYSHSDAITLRRMHTVLNEHPDDSPEELDAAMHKAVAEFVGEAEQFDDMTMLCVKINKREAVAQIKEKQYTDPK